MSKTFNDLVELMNRLRSPGGCPWDREQTYATLAPMLLEEAYDLVAEKKVSVTDEVSAVELLGRKIALVPNHDFNFKITYPRDLPLAEFVLKQRAAATRR